MQTAQHKSIQVTDAMADLVAALEDLLGSHQEEPSEALVRLTEATHRLASSWAEYQEALDPAAWAQTKQKLASDLSNPAPQSKT